MLVPNGLVESKAGVGSLDFQNNNRMEMRATNPAPITAGRNRFIDTFGTISASMPSGYHLFKVAPFACNNAPKQCTVV